MFSLIVLLYIYIRIYCIVSYDSFSYRVRILCSLLLLLICTCMLCLTIQFYAVFMVLSAVNGVVLCWSGARYSRTLVELLEESLKKSTAELGLGEVATAADQQKKKLVKKINSFARLLDVLLVVSSIAFIATAFWPWLRNRFLYILPLGMTCSLLICAASCFLIKY